MNPKKSAASAAAPSPSPPPPLNEVVTCGMLGGCVPRRDGASSTDVDAAGPRSIASVMCVWKREPYSSGRSGTMPVTVSVLRARCCVQTPKIRRATRKSREARSARFASWREINIRKDACSTWRRIADLDLSHLIDDEGTRDAQARRSRRVSPVY